jgi:hypothetical protein
VNVTGRLNCTLEKLTTKVPTAFQGLLRSASSRFAWCSTDRYRQVGLSVVIATLRVGMIGLTRMTGNCHVRFLGEGPAAMPFPYPTCPQKGEDLSWDTFLEVWDGDDDGRSTGKIREAGGAEPAASHLPPEPKLAPAITGPWRRAYEKRLKRMLNWGRLFSIQCVRTSDVALHMKLVGHEIFGLHLLIGSTNLVRDY